MPSKPYTKMGAMQAIVASVKNLAQCCKCAAHTIVQS